MKSNFLLPANYRRASFGVLYSQLELHNAALRTYTKSLFYRRKSLSKSHDGRNLYDFARQTGQNLERLHKDLIQERFRFRPGIKLEYCFNRKDRTIYLFPWEERIVDLLLYRVLTRYFHGAFSSHSYAYRHRGFGVDVCQNHLAQQLRRMSQPVFILKRDISDYFASVDHGLLLEMLSEWVEPEDYLFQLLSERILFKTKLDEDVEIADRGIPFGSAVSCFFANLYLTPLDKILAALPGVSFFRYADDLIVLTSDSGQAKIVNNLLDDTFTLLKLKTKPSHHLNLLLSKVVTEEKGFTFVSKFRHLGLEFRASGIIGLSRDKQRKIANLFRRAFLRTLSKMGYSASREEKVQCLINVAKKIVEENYRSVAVIDYYLKHTEDELQLRELDRWIAEKILALVLRTGHRKGNFRVVSFAKLRELGLPSLLHRRRLLLHGQIESPFFDFRSKHVGGERRA